jgi:hypothetical protein
MIQQANDLFETYYTEKLWALVPEVYRYEDAAGVLRSIIELLAHEAAIVRRSNDRLWEDQVIDLCDEWAVPYIGALVATRMLSDKNLRGRRVDVAKTIYYRRRKGTPRVLEELISDIAGWEGVVVEEFRRLGRARHGLDAFPAPLAGRLTGTMPGGWADLREPVGSELADGPFEEYFHTPDFRFPRGLDGRYGIPKLAFYLYRLNYYPMTGVTPFKDGVTLRFSFDPSGRTTQLFNLRQRPESWDDWHPALEWELPAPIRCRLLGDAEYLITQAVVDKIFADPAPPLVLSADQQTELAKLYNQPFEDEGSLRAVFNGYPHLKLLITPVTTSFFFLLLKYALVTCGKKQLLPVAISVECNAYPNGVPVEQTTAANLMQAPPTDKALEVDPVNGLFFFTVPATDAGNALVHYYMGFSGPLGAGTYSRPDLSTVTPDKTRTGGGAIAAGDIPAPGILRLADNQTYGPAANPGSVESLVIEAGDQLRPYVRLTADWVFTAKAGADAVLVLDGLWIGEGGVVLQGDWDSVTIRNCAFDPGGDKTISGASLKMVVLTVQGTIDTLCVHHSIMGPIAVTGAVEMLTICDSILQSTDATPVLQQPAGKTTLENVTIFGIVNVDHLEASGVVMTGKCTVSDTQHGCFRFSAAPAASQVPRPYESLLFTDDTNSWWNSQRFGDAEYAQLSDVAPAKLLSGGEEGYEIGAFASLLNPFKQQDLETKVQEYMPFGLISIFIHQT